MIYNDNSAQFQVFFSVSEGKDSVGFCISIISSSTEYHPLVYVFVLKKKYKKEGGI